MNMFSPKLIAVVLVVLGLIAGNVVLLMRNADLTGQVDALSEALATPSTAEEELERANAELNEQLGKAKEEAEGLKARGEKMEELLVSQRQALADLELKVKSYEAERAAMSEATGEATGETSGEPSDEATGETSGATEESSAVSATAASAAEPVAGASGQDIVHVVRRGELLRELADRYYGDPNQWQRILDANKGTVRDARSLIPGTELIIPGATQQ